MRLYIDSALAILLLPWVVCGVAHAMPSARERQRRQVSVDDLINTALQFVRPIFDTSQTLAVNQHDPIIHKKMLVDGQNPSNGLRESTILGTPNFYSSLRDVPICRGNSQICKFISCTAHNFKHDANLANLNLAVQLIGDKKFRETISKNPETITAVCHEQGLSREQCRIFSRAFQLIDRFISTLESGPIVGGMLKSTTPEDYLAYTNEVEGVQRYPISPAHRHHLSAPPPLNQPSDDDGDIGGGNSAAAAATTTTNPTSPATRTTPSTTVTTPPRRQTPLTPIRPVNYPTSITHPQTTPVYADPLLPLPGRIAGSRTWSTHGGGGGGGSGPFDSFGREPQRSLSPSVPARVIDSVRMVVNYTSELGDDSLLARPMSVAPQTSTRLLSANSWNLLSRPAPPSAPPRAVLPSSSLPTLHSGSVPSITRLYSTDATITAVAGRIEADSTTTPQQLMSTTLSTIPEAEEEEGNYELTELPSAMRDEKSLAEELFKPLLRKRRSPADDYYDDVATNVRHSATEGDGLGDKGGGNGGAHSRRGSFLRLDCLQYMPHLIG